MSHRIEELALQGGEAAAERDRPPTPTPVPGKAVAYQYSRHRRNVGRARDALRYHLAAWQIDGDTADAAVLLLSELVANAVTAKTGRDREVRVGFELNGPELRLAVEDASDEKPRPRQAGPDDESGRGLALVSVLADSWGVAPRVGVGKTVWATLVLPEGAAP